MSAYDVRPPNFVRIKGDVVTLLVWRSYSVGQVLLVITALAIPAIVYVLLGWWLTLWACVIAVAVLRALYRTTLVKIHFAPPFVIIDCHQYPIYRIARFTSRWIGEDSEIDDDAGQVVVYLQLDEDDPILLARMSGAADAPAIERLLNERLSELRR